MRLLLRRTLVLKNLRSTIDRRQSTVVPNAQVSDTTGDAMKNCCPVQKFYTQKTEVVQNKKAMKQFTAFCL